MMKEKKKVVKDQVRTKRARQFLLGGWADYMAARVLFLASMPEQAAVLASTSIEKYFKALMAIHGQESHGHLKSAHWNSVRNLDPRLFSILKPDFLQLNQKCYQLRYTDDLKPGFNLVIAAREFLAELDFTVLTIQSLFKLKSADGQALTTAYDEALNEQDGRLWQDNHMLLKQNKEAFIFAAPQLVYEIRFFNSENIIEMRYHSEARPNDPSMMRAAMQVDPMNERSFRTAYRYMTATPSSGETSPASASDSAP